MAYKARIMFFATLLSQVILLLIYIAVKEYSIENTVTSRQTIKYFTAFQDISTFQAAISTHIGPSTFPVATRLSQRTTNLTSFTEEQERKRSGSTVGSSDHQKGTSVYRTTPRPSDFQKETPVHQRTLGLPKQEYFQSVDGKEAWFYSAFYDYVAAGQGHPSVRLFGVVDNKFLVNAFCNLSLADGKSLLTNASVQPMPDNHHMNFSPSYLACPLPSNVRPTNVSISFQEKATPTNHLLIQYPGPRIRNFTVCFSVMYGNNILLSQFIQSIEMNQILGAEHFIVYVYKVSTQLEKIMRLYEDDGILTIKQWPLPTNKSHYFSQMTALSDCFYTNRNTSRFVVVVDTDELIIPRNNNNWMELINNISPQEVDVSNFLNSSAPVKSRTSHNGCFTVRSSFFSRSSYPDWDNLPKQYYFDENEKQNILKFAILALSQFVREQNIFPPGVRTKYIARPEHVWNAGIHYVHSFVNSMTCADVNESLALVHHYRKFGLKIGINDTSILKYKHLLYPRVMHQLERFQQIFAKQQFMVRHVSQG